MEISVETKFRVEFYDVDSMDVAWHGNYVKYLELGRCALLDKIGYGYKEMKKTGYVFPVVTLNLKYVRSLFFGCEYVIKTTLVEYENRIKMKFEIRDAKTDELCTKADCVQMAVKTPEMTSLFECPKVFIDKVEEFKKQL